MYDRILGKVRQVALMLKHRVNLLEINASLCNVL